jgi:hypothetical protein
MTVETENMPMTFFGLAALSSREASQAVFFMGPLSWPNYGVGEPASQIDDASNNILQFCFSDNETWCEDIAKWVIEKGSLVTPSLPPSPPLSGSGARIDS